MITHTLQQIEDLLQSVKDPEIPVLSLVDLGVITKMEINPTEGLYISITPTFAGCPAIDVMRQGIVDVLESEGITPYKVDVTFTTPWSSDRITPNGIAALKAFGLAPPRPFSDNLTDIDILDQIECPHCASSDTELRSLFGPTLCRSLYYCNSCLQGFENFKAL